MSLATPWALLLLLVLPLWAWWQRRQRAGFRHPRVGLVEQIQRAPRRWVGRLPYLLRGALLAALVLAVARPRTGTTVVETESEGIAIVLAVDISSSMLALDMTPRDRLEAAKETVGEFVRARPYDRLGLVAFAGEALTQVPVTVDHGVVRQAVANLQVGQLEDGTAIGTAIATAANRLRHAPGESKVIVLLTDGENNRGEIDPLTAAQAAAAYGVRIYTIGVGRDGVAPVPVARGPFGFEYANMPVRIDETLLRRVAETTGGQYFRATNAQALSDIYERIDVLERTPVSVRRTVEYSDYGKWWLALAVGLLLAEWLVRARRHSLLA